MGYVDNIARNKAAMAIAKACKLEARVGTIELFLDMLEGLTDDQIQAIINANLPSALNPFATLADLGLDLTITIVPNFSALPDPTTVPGSFYFAQSSEGTWWLPGSLGGTYHNAGLYYSNGISWKSSDLPFQATQAEVGTEVGDGGIVTDKFVTPQTLNGKGFSKIVREAGETIPAHRAVIIESNALYLFDKDNTNHYGKCVGISYTSGIIGNDIEVITDDEVTLGIPLTDGAVYYATTGGLISATPPTTGIVQKIGIATTNSKIMIDIQTPIQKAS